MIAWAAYSVILAGLLTIAAEAVQRALSTRGRGTRFLWVGALAGSMVLPVVLPLLARGQPPASEAAFLPPTFSIALDLPPVAVTDTPVLSLREVLLMSWVTGSVLLLLWGGITLVRLARARRSWRRERIDSATVLVSPNTGPAVVGFVRPAVVVPDWILTLPPTQRGLVIAHERAHIEARDPLLLLFARVVPALLPWNPAVWVQSRRLREAIELDCDRRLIRRGASANRYAELLLDVGRRGSRSLLTAVTLSEPRSLLEKRIRHMLEPRPRRSWLQVGVYGLFGASALMLVAATPRPGDPAVASAAVSQQDPTVPPRLRNPEELKSAVAAAYPSGMYVRGIEGKAVISVRVSAVGRVLDARIKSTSGQDAFDAAALKVARQMRYLPGRVRGRVGTAWVDLPIEFSIAPNELTAQQKEERARAVALAKAEVERTERGIQARARVQPFDPPILQPRERTAAAEKAENAAITNPPILGNREEVRRVTERFYPPLLKDAGIGGTALIRLQLDATGQVQTAELAEGSGHRALDEAALKIAELMQFEPARNREDRVGVWIVVPVTFTPPNERRQGLDSVVATAINPALGPTFTPFTVAPQLQNQDEVARLLQRYYPPLLRNAGIGGTALIWFLIDQNGQVVKVQLKNSAGHEALDEAALKVASQLRFSPAMNRDRKVKVWVDMPIVFKSQ